MFWKKLIFWITAVIITLSASVYQRMTGPSYPKKYVLSTEESIIRFTLPRSHGGDDDCPVSIKVPEGYQGNILYRRFPGSAPFDTIVMKANQDTLCAALPHQPPAGKLEYHLELFRNGKKIDTGDRENIIIRFKGAVPAWILIPHILLMFLAMIWSNATALFAAGKLPAYKKYLGITIILFLAGGFIFGPVVQYYAFGDLWTGWPNGKDLTDNKVLIAIIVWIIAWIFNRKKERRWLAVLAALVLLGIYLIPHSMNGSELDYESGKVITGTFALISSLSVSVSPGKDFTQKR